MIEIIVQRGAGDKPGPDIQDNLLSTVPAALRRGQAEIDASTSTDVVRLRTTKRSGVTTGQLVEVHDALQGAVWVGKIIGILIPIRGPAVWMDLDIERPING